ncbi:hypothetical protein K9O30_05500 [Clostridium bowmanii]|uniref:hypothetical protein n=1 Tax=Clostridium bowmanii TaxID=132925 RepID=UPI001C0BA72A|nr:hypothetical protein [Clostridium bowmanii]MBU3191646.1 hypothetical protein [Clostridium bowmanii]MCA1073200.1 hypothetical protein [Clostridium bowmanii]
MIIKHKEINDLKEEIEIILSIKDEISDEEINNFVDSFPSLTESEVREKIAEITGDDEYLIEEVNIDERFDEKQINLQNNALEIAEIAKVTEIPEMIGIEAITEHSQIKKEQAEQIMVNKIEESKEKSKPTVEALNTMLTDIVAVVGEVKHNQLFLQWQWPEKANRAKVVYRRDSFSKSAEDSSAVASVIKREKDEVEGVFVIDNIVEGNYYFTIYVMTEINGQFFYSAGKRRLMVNRKPIEIYYDLKIKRSLLGKLKSAEIFFSMEEDEEIKLPAITAIGKRGNMPIQKSDGDDVCTFNEVVITKNKLSAFDFPIEAIQNNMYIKLFVMNDKESTRYRIISPAREKLYFK